jgi:hypothetical protein
VPFATDAKRASVHPVILYFFLEQWPQGRAPGFNSFYCNCKKSAAWLMDPKKFIKLK